MVGRLQGYRYKLKCLDSNGLDTNLSSEARLTIRGAIPVGQEDICGQPLGLRVRNMDDGDGNSLPPNYTLTCEDDGIFYDRTVTTTEDHFFGWAPNYGDCAASYSEPCYTYDWGFSVTPTSPIGCSYPEAPAAGVSGEPAVQAALVQGYRFGFQAQEADHEEYGGYGKWEYKFRGHNPAIGRFFAVDPLRRKYPHNSTYAFSENRLLDGIELEGLEALQLVGGVSATAYFVHAGAEFSIVADLEDVIVYLSPELGVGLGSSGVTHGGIAVYPNASATELGGWSIEFSADAGIASIEGALGFHYDERTGEIGNVPIGGGLARSFGGGQSANLSVVYSFELVREKTENLLTEGKFDMNKFKKLLVDQEVSDLLTNPVVESINPDIVNQFLEWAKTMSETENEDQPSK